MMDEIIARALLKDFLQKGLTREKREFYDDARFYVVQVEVTVRKRDIHENLSKALHISAGPGGSPCTCCGGTGRA
jgi:hypothetical protein